MSVSFAPALAGVRECENITEALVNIADTCLTQGHLGQKGRYTTRNRTPSLKATEIVKAKDAILNSTVASVKKASACQNNKTQDSAEVSNIMARTAAVGKSNAPTKKVTARAPTKGSKQKATSESALPNVKPPGVKKTAPKAKTTTASTTKGRGKAAATAAAVAKAPASTKKAPAKANAEASKKASAQAPSKRKVGDEESEGENDAPPPAKKVRVIREPVARPKVLINKAPTQRLDVFVFGEGSSSELGLGTAKNAIDVKRPRLNPLLSAKDVGVVQIAAGGMHAAALTHDNKILTWGVNDSGALGRDTKWDGGLKDMDDNQSDDSDQSDSGLNPRESIPTEIPASTFPAGTIFVKLSAGDSHTLALTDDGLVYGWGVFRVGTFTVEFGPTT